MLPVQDLCINQVITETQEQRETREQRLERLLKDLYEVHCRPGCSHEGEGKLDSDAIESKYRVVTKEIEEVLGESPAKPETQR